MTEKRCPRCDTVKPVEQFYLNRSHKDGHATNCIACELEAGKRWRAKRREEKARTGPPPLVNGKPCLHGGRTNDITDKWMPEPNSGCWLWLGAEDENGYGRVVAGDGTRRIVKAHRRVYELLVGPIPEGMMLRHKCDTRCCVNPAHLEPGTVTDNARDMVERGRLPNPATIDYAPKLTEEQVRRIRDAHDNGQSKLSLTREYGIAYTTVSMIVQRKTWKNVA